jgi:hypothetical protein
MEMIRLYWWDAEEGKKNIHWVFWNKLVRPKCRDGTGFILMVF